MLLFSQRSIDVTAEILRYSADFTAQISKKINFTQDLDEHKRRLLFDLKVFYWTLVYHNWNTNS
jgi:hypothetical protein